VSSLKLRSDRLIDLGQLEQSSRTLQEQIVTFFPRDGHFHFLADVTEKTIKSLQEDCVDKFVHAIEGFTQADREHTSSHALSDRLSKVYAMISHEKGIDRDLIEELVRARGQLGVGTLIRIYQNVKNALKSTLLNDGIFMELSALSSENKQDYSMLKKIQNVCHDEYLSLVQQNRRDTPEGGDIGGDVPDAPPLDEQAIPMPFIEQSSGVSFPVAVKLKKVGERSPVSPERPTQAQNVQDVLKHSIARVRRSVQHEEFVDEDEPDFD